MFILILIVIIDIVRVRRDLYPWLRYFPGDDAGAARTGVTARAAAVDRPHQPDHLDYIHLNDATMRSAEDRRLWPTEAWYTLNRIPGAATASAQ